MADNDGIVATRQNADANADDASPVFPFYLLVDVSGSMIPDIKALNAAVGEFRDKLKADPVTWDCVLFSVISFGSTARVEVPLSDFSAAEFGADLLRINGSTSYSEAFRTLKETIERDLINLRHADQQAGSGRDKYRYYRPAAFFLTDGVPDRGDPWQQAFSELTSMKAHPLFVPFGFRDANDSILRQLVHPVDRSKLYFTRSHDVGAMLNEMLEVMLVSVLSSAHSVDTKPMHVLPAATDVAPDIEVQQYVDGDWV